VLAILKWFQDKFRHNTLITFLQSVKIRLGSIMVKKFSIGPGSLNLSVVSPTKRLANGLNSFESKDTRLGGSSFTK